MLMPTKDRIAIFETLYNDGVLTAEKNFVLASHPDIEGVKNLHVIKACQSLLSKGFVTEQYAWRHFYWFLTENGIKYIREYLHLPSDVVPKTTKSEPPISTGAQFNKRQSSNNFNQSDRQNYRNEGVEKKNVDTGMNLNPEFHGRGRTSFNSSENTQGRFEKK